MPFTKNYDVFGMCNPLYDIQAEVSEETLAAVGYEKGGMHLIDEHQQQSLVTRIYEHIVNAESGGSGANTMIALSLLGGKASYTGKLGADEHGALYAQKLNDRGVQLCARPGAGTTGICVVLVTPDAERTMCTFLGICRELGPDDIDEEALRRSKYLYVTGYLWDTELQKAAVLKAMRVARSAGVRVALSLSDPFCVDRHREAFTDIASDYVDLLIGNQEEMSMLTGANSSADAIEATSSLCDMAAITVGSQGALIRDGSSVYEIPGYRVDPVDTTGAGDTFAAGILYGLTAGLPVERSGKIACYLAAQVVAKLGPRLQSVNSTDIMAL